MSKEVVQPESMEVEDVVQRVNRGADWEIEREAQDGAIAEHTMTVRQAFAAYWKAVLWSVTISWAVIMESYDIQIVGSFYAYPSFQKKYGVQTGPNSYQVTSPWQVGLSCGSNIGIIIGIFLNGWMIEAYGHRRLLLVALVFQAAFIFITFFAPSIEVLLVGEILCGLPWGVFNTVAPSYAVEVCPLALRGYLTTFVNLCWVIGHLIGAGILDGLVNNTTEWSYRIPFAVQWVWPLPLFIAISLAPDSPWWLVRKNRVDDAEKSVKRFASSKLVNAKDAVALMVHTTKLEASLKIGGSYLACFKGTDLRRTEIACVSWASQAYVGFAVQNYSTYFFEQAGLAASDAFKLTLGTFSIAFVGTVSSWFTQTYFGRRTLFLVGTAFMAPLLFIVGFLQLAPQATDSIRWAQAIILLVWFGGYGSTIGPIPYVIASEISSSTLRTKTLSLARDSFYLSNLLNSIVAPYMLNPQNANLKGIAAFPAASFNVALFVWAWFRLPESKGRTFEELDILFAKGVPARQFKGYVVDPYEGAAGQGSQVGMMGNEKDGSMEKA